MDEAELVYLIASFPNVDALKRAARSLAMPRERMAVLGNPESGALEAARELGLPTRLHSKGVELDEGQDTQLRWHLEHENTPLLAVTVVAEQGREARLQLTELGGEMLFAPHIHQQVNDLSYDPGMGSAEPPLPPGYNRITPTEVRERPAEDES